MGRASRSSHLVGLGSVRDLAVTITPEGPERGGPGRPHVGCDLGDNDLAVPFGPQERTGSFASSALGKGKRLLTNHDTGLTFLLGSHGSLK
jgi:hypothetical protein